MGLSNKEAQQQQIDRRDQHSHPAHQVRARRDTHENQYRNAEDNAKAAADHQVVCRRRSQIRIHFTQKQNARADGPRHHTKHRDEAFLIIGGVNLFAHRFQMIPGHNAADHGQKQERKPQAAQILHIDGGNTGHNHQIKKEAGYAIQEIIVLILPFDEASFFAALQQKTQQDRQSGTDDEIETPDQCVQGFGKTGRDCRDAGRQAVSCKIRPQIGEKHQGQLNGELINGVRNRDLIFILEKANIHMLFPFSLTLSFIFPRHEVQHDNADNTGHQITGRSNGEAKAAPAGKAQRFIG